ncbi:hypothetical protein I4U23_019529 [Adineta vaga]|nr:hypothetical protein I4U23_019529 [Adineta vaga]
MSYSIVTFILLFVVALSSSLKNIELNDDENVYIRLYPKFAQLFRPRMIKSDLAKSTLRDVEQYKFSFNENEFSNIAKDTLTILFTNITDRMIVRHRSPNFEKVGTQYIYRRDSKETEGIQIELANVEDRLFREVQRPTRYFYLTSFDNLEYTSKMPIMPYYEVTFTCNKTLTKDQNLPSPLLSYIDNSFSWIPRYIIELRSLDMFPESILSGYADIYNNGYQTVTIGGLEFVSGDIKLNADSNDFINYAPIYSYQSYKSSSEKEVTFTPFMNKEASGSYVYQIFTKSAFILPPHSIKTIEFAKKNITVQRFHYYASIFEPINSRGKLLSAYNITSYDSFIPSGPVSLHLEGRFLGQTKLPDLAIGETYSVIFGYDADVSYHRKVTVSESNQKNKPVIYHVEYTFKNTATAMDTTVEFVESLGSLKYFEIKNISSIDGKTESSHIIRHGTDLKATFVLPHNNSKFTIHYDILVYKSRPIIDRRH